MRVFSPPGGFPGVGDLCEVTMVAGAVGDDVLQGDLQVVGRATYGHLGKAELGALAVETRPAR